MIGLYRPGRSLAHRAPAGLKALLMLMSVSGLVLMPSAATVWALTTGLVAALLALGVPRTALTEQWRAVAPWLVTLAVLQSFSGDPWAGVRAAGVLAGSVSVGAALTATTTMTALLLTLTRVLTPVRALGLDPGRPAFMVMLLVRSVPLITTLAEQTDEALRARGARRTPRTYVVPLLIRTLRHADLTAEALEARGGLPPSR